MNTVITRRTTATPATPVLTVPTRSVQEMLLEITFRLHKTRVVRRLPTDRKAAPVTRPA